jgi:hypothetical protein
MYKITFTILLSLFFLKSFSQTVQRSACRECIKLSKNKKATVYISFRLNPDSSITKIQVVRSLCDACDKDALTIFSRLKFDNLVGDKPVDLIHPIRVLTN